MDSANSINVKVIYQVEQDGKWLKSGSISIEKEFIGKVKAACSKALACQGTPVGSRLKWVGTALFFVGTSLTYAACVKWGGSKWLSTVPAVFGCVFGVGG